MLSTYWRDDSGLVEAILSTNETGNWENKTEYGSPLNLFGNEDWGNFTWYNYNNISKNTSIGWRVHVKNIDGYWNSTEVNVFDVLKEEIFYIDTNLLEDRILSLENLFKFEFILKNYEKISNCFLMIDGEVTNTTENLTLNEYNVLYNEILPTHDFNWSVSCIDIYGNLHESDTKSVFLENHCKGVSKINRFISGYSLDTDVFISLKNIDTDFKDNTTSLQSVELDKGKYDMVLSFKENELNHIELKNTFFCDDVEYLIELNSNISNPFGRKTQSFSFDIKNVYFEEIIINFTSFGNKVYFCNDWDSSFEICNEKWEFKQNLEKEKNYEITSNSSNFAFVILETPAAHHLDINKNKIECVYQNIKNVDGNWSPTLRLNESIRIFFSEYLYPNENIYIIVKNIQNNSKIIMYYDETEIPIFEFICEELICSKNISLSNMEDVQDTFYLTVSEGEAKFNLITNEHTDFELYKNQTNKIILEYKGIEKEYDTLSSGNVISFFIEDTQSFYNISIEAAKNIDEGRIIINENCNDFLEEENKILYDCISIYLENISNEQIKNGRIYFKISIDWLNENNISVSNLYLYKLSEELEDIGIEELYSDKNYYYFTSEFNNFSYFGVYGLKLEESLEVIEEEIIIEEETEEIVEPTTHEEIPIIERDIYEESTSNETEEEPEEETEDSQIKNSILIILIFITIVGYILTKMNIDKKLIFK